MKSRFVKRSVYLDQLLINMGEGDEGISLATSSCAIMPTPAPPASSGAHYFFISCAYANLAVAEQVESYIRSLGWKVFCDATGIHADTNWYMTIETELRETDAIVPLLSPTSMPCRREIYREWFLYDQMCKPIFPLLTQTWTLHSYLMIYSY